MVPVPPYWWHPATKPDYCASANRGAASTAPTDLAASSPEGAVVLDDGLASFDCTIYREVEAGDHVLVLLRLHAVEQAEGTGSPLVFHRSAFGTLTSLR